MVPRIPTPRLHFQLVSLLFGLSLTANVHAHNDQAMADRLAITDTLTQYSYRWDTKDSSGFAELFTADGIMERWLLGELVEDSKVESRQAIYEYAKRSHEGRLADRQTRHHFSGIVFLELNEDSAVTENMALITHQTANDNVAFISSSGVYRISWRKTPEGWRISRRILKTDKFQP
ncbi:MAG: nuclear transport factor 2 family protein [Gammaproteobacteria bacterium]|nr:nuclear transport factor 2 family protein [Gammaproteobacteria bacterium]MDD9960393.1 nuclear transport factor 2 family protein [Gammaproteobacteria bacterium]